MTLTTSEELRLELLKTILETDAISGQQRVASSLGYDPYQAPDPMVRLRDKVNAMHDIVRGVAIPSAPDHTQSEQPSETERNESGC